MKTIRLLIHALILRPLVWIYSGLRATAYPGILPDNNFVMVSNHNSHLDILLLYNLIPLKRIFITHPVAAKDYFCKYNILFRLVSFLLDPIWVNREDEHCKVDFMDQTTDYLAKGHNILMFPEGTRGKPGVIGSFKNGIGQVAELFRNTPIVPVYLSGTEKFFPKRCIIPRIIRPQIRIGQPLTFYRSYTQTTLKLEKTIRQMAADSNKSESCFDCESLFTRGSVAVLGIDGSGKSTISQKLVEILSQKTRKAVLISDRLWFFSEGKPKKTRSYPSEYVRRLISRITSKAKSLKLYKIPKMMELILRNRLHGKIEKSRSQHNIILDGSPLLNLVAWSYLYKKTLDSESVSNVINFLTSQGKGIDRNDEIYSEYPELKMLKRCRMANLKLPDKVIFMDTSVATALERISKREKKLQVHETEEKLGRLRDAYHLVCSVVKDKFAIPVLIINGNQNLENISKEAIDFMNITNGKSHG